MSFIDSYKRLEKLCSEMYENGVSSYIDEMINTVDGSRYVAGWDADLKQLKHCRWARNKISHDPDCNEENTCEPGDELWLNDFRSRIMNVRDPLSLYRKAKQSNKKQTNSVQRQTTSTQSKTYTTPQRNNEYKNPSGCLTCIIGILLVALVIIGCM